MTTYREYREEVAKGDTKKNAGLTIPEDVEVIRDLFYGNHGEESRMEIFYPKDKPLCNPTILNCHGGGWVTGGIWNYRYYCADMARYGFTVICFNYRMAPETPFPGMLEDVNTLAGWVMENGKNYHIDTDRLFVIGDSSGGQVASQYLTLLTNQDFAKLFPFQVPEGFHVRACVLNCGAYDARYFLENDPDSLIHYYVPERTDKVMAQMDALSNITSAFPPAYISTGTADFLKDGAAPMAELLESRGVPCKRKVWGSKTDPEEHDFQLDLKNKTGALCREEEARFLMSYC